MSARGRKAKVKDRNAAADATTNGQDEDDLTQGINYPNPKGRRGDAVQRRMRAAEERKEKREERLKEKERLAEEGGKGKGKKKKGRRRSDSLDDEPGQEGEPPEKGKAGVASRGRSTKDNKDVQANGHLDEDYAPHPHHQKKSEPLRRMKGSIDGTSVPNETSSTESTSLRRNPRFRKAVEMTSSSDGRTRLRLQQDGDSVYSTTTTSSIPPLLASLPSEVWVYLLGYLNNTERLALSNTCKGWRYFVLELRQHHKVGKKWNHSKAIIEQLQFLNNFCPRLRSLVREIDFYLKKILV